MTVSSTFIGLVSVADKVDHLAIEAAIASLPFPVQLTAEYDQLGLAVIARGDNVYPQEHYRIGNTLYLALQFNPESFHSLSTEAVTQAICDKVAAYLPTIREVEEREMQEMKF